jgi:nucleotide-binding universal stress UspA family protein
VRWVTRVSGIVVGVDRSEPSNRAVHFAAALAARDGTALTVVHVIPWSPYSFNTPSENEERHRRREEEIAAATEQVIEPAVAAAKEEGVEATTVVRHGDPVDLIIEETEQRGADLIVMGRSGDSRVKRAIFGSYPSALVQEAPVPVVVIP